MTTPDEDVALRDEVTGLLQRLIACDTANPPGDEAQAAAVIEEHLRDTGLECRRIAKDPNRPNLLITLRGDGDGPTLGFLGHLDVVVARREDWSVEPFGGIERDGVIWGRGAVDMKGQVAASVVALATLAREGFRPKGDIMILLMADEEVADSGVGSDHFTEALPDLRLDYVVGEGSGERYVTTTAGPVYLLDHGVKGSASATLTAMGCAGDASLQDAGRSAVFNLAELLLRIRDYEPRTRIHPALRPALDALAGDGDGEDDEARLERARAAHPQLGRILYALTHSVLRPTIIEVPGPVNAVADRAKVEIQVALVPGTTAEELEAELREALGDGDYELEVVPPVGGELSPLDTPLHDAIASFLAEHDPEASLIPSLGYGFSDCEVMRTSYNAVAYGFIPFRHGDPAVNLDSKHGSDERVLVDDLVFQTRAALHVARTMGRVAQPAQQPA
jgi:acetylornithine deacetylase/succinyl-diaminopimelate desuccinylase-like protein